MSFTQELNPQQTFPHIDIQSEGDTIVLNNASWGQSLDRLQELLSEMGESKFYKRIDVMLGAKTKQKVNYLEEHYQQKTELLNLSLEEEKEYLKGIVQASNQEELKLRELTHQQNQLVIQKRMQNVPNPDYYPCIYVCPQKKGPLFGQVQQDINRHGAGTLTAQVGYRSPLQKYDHLQLNLEWPLQTKLNKRYYQFGVSWFNPIKHQGDFFVRYNSGNDATYENIDTHCNGVSCGLSKGKQNYEVQWNYRAPFIHKNTAHSIRQGFHRPSTKCSLKYSRILQNTLQHNSVSEGSFSKFKSELGLPLIGSSQFLRLEYVHRKFYDTFAIRKYFSSKLLNKMFWKSTIETNFSAATLTQFGQKNFINESLEPLEVRGFQSLRRPLPSHTNLRGSFKFNVHNYPFLSEANIVYFLYSQGALSFLKSKPLINPCWLGSAGMGFSFNFGPAQLQLLCNLMQFQNKRLREPTGFQFRFSIND